MAQIGSKDTFSPSDCQMPLRRSRHVIKVDGALATALMNKDNIRQVL